MRTVTNLFAAPDRLSDPAWDRERGGAASVPVVTDNFALAPDGTFTASRVQMTLNGGTTSGDICFIRQMPTLTPTLCVVVWMKLHVGSSAIVRVADRYQFTVTNQWQPFPVTFPTNPGNDVRIVQLWGGVTSDTVDLLLWHPDLEDVTGKFNQSYSEWVNGSQNFDSTPASIAMWGDSLSTRQLPDAMRFLCGQASGAGPVVFDGGHGGDTSTQVKTRMLAAPERFPSITTIWVGRNNYTDTNTVVSDVQAMVQALGHNKFVVLSVPNGDYANEYFGQSGWTYIRTLNAALLNAFPNNYLDIRALLIEQYNPAIPQDVTDHINDIHPSSLRIDAVHLTPAGYAFVAKQIKAFIDAKGWSLASTATIDGVTYSVPSLSLHG